MGLHGPACATNPGRSATIWIQRLLELFDRLRIGALEIPVFAFTETVSTHLDRCAEQAVVGIESAQIRRLGLVIS